MIRTIGKSIAAVLGLVVLLAVALILWPAPEAPLADPARNRLIENVRVVDVVTGTAGPLVAVEIRDGAIAAIGPGIVAGDLARLNGRGGFLVPGFWDMHVHSFQASPQMHLPLWIANGVTNVRDMMDCPQERDSLIACAGDKRRWNAEVAAGQRTAPRIVEVASYYLERPELTPQDAVARVRTYKARGIDAVKVYNRLSPATYRAAATEARAQRLRLVGHLPKAVGLDEAIDAGQLSFEHAHILPRHCFARADDWRQGRLDGEAPTALAEMIVAGHDPARCAAAFARMRQAGTWLVPTHVTREEDARAGDPGFANDPRLDYLDPLSRWAWNDDLGGTLSRYPGVRGERALRAYFDHGLRLTGQAHAAGVGILVGTDTGLGGFRYHDEMAHLVRAGLTTADVLRAATIDAARYVGMEASAGSIAIGKRADLVLLDANPLVDIANTRRIRAVVQDGRLYDRERLNALLAFVRGQASAVHNSAKLLWAFARSSVSGDL